MYLNTDHITIGPSAQAEPMPAPITIAQSFFEASGNEAPTSSDYSEKIRFEDFKGMDKEDIQQWCQSHAAPADVDQCVKHVDIEKNVRAVEMLLG